MKKSFISLCIISILLFTITGLAGCGETVSYQSADTLPEKEQVQNAVDASEPEESHEIYVSILGEVMYPGVYILEEGSRLFEAVNMAGGVTEDADLSGINLVGFAEDGMQINVPHIDNQSYVNNETVVILTNHDGMVNINTADSETLKTIPGIGDTRAAAIIEYREKNGKFESSEDIMKVSGIKSNTYESIKDYIYAE